VVLRLAIVAGDQREQRRLAAELEQANAAKSDFLATMSHEIRTPLNAVIGMSGLLLDSPLTAEQKEYAEVTRSAGESLLSIINDILDFSKIEAGRLDLEAHPFALHDCVESAVDLLAPLADAKQIQFAYLVDRDLPAAVTGDLTRLRQVLVNLMSNAIKFTEQGEVLLRVTRESEDGDLVRFSISDTGPGIPHDRISRIFEEFRQEDSSTTRVHGGTGLGLAISRRLAEAMGGAISVASEVGSGSTFSFTATLPEATDAPVRECLDAEEMIGKHLLVVDDNATNRQIVLYQLQTWRMTASATGDPAEAVAWIRDGQRFDAAILDMQMPGMDGIELAQALRRAGADGLPLILRVASRPSSSGICTSMSTTS
jgi:signal transduction histidine kinase